MFFVIFSVLELGFYLINKILEVNYPEDRTGLFFYVFFVLLLNFTLDKSSVKLNSIIGCIIAVLFFLHFLVNLNFRKHSLNVFEIMPEHFIKPYWMSKKNLRNTKRLVVTDYMNYFIGLLIIVM